MSIVYDLPADEYHAHPAVGSTSLKTLYKQPPAVYKYQQTHPPQSDAFDVGTVAHAPILEQDDSIVQVVDVDRKSGKAWSEPAAEAREHGLIPLKRSEWDTVEAMRDAVMAHPVAAELLTGHAPEVSYFTQLYEGLDVKCRADALTKDNMTVVDLKTTGASADPTDFARTAYNLGYHQSAAHYQDVIKQVTGFTPAFVFIVVSKHPPYLTSVVELHPDFVEYGRQANHVAANTLKACTASGRWPGYTDTTVIDMPRWAQYQEDQKEES